MESKDTLIHHLAGYRAFLIQSLNKEETEIFGNKKVLRYIDRIQRAILFLDLLDSN